MSDDIFIKQDQVIGQQPFISQTAVSGQAYTTSQRVYQVPASGQTPFTYINRTPTQTRSPLNVQTPSTYQHRSPLTYNHRSPSTYNHRSPLTYNHRSPFTYANRQPSTYNHRSPYRSPFTYQHREPNTYNHRSPFIVQITASKQSPFNYQHREPISYIAQTPSTYEHRSPLIYQHRSPFQSPSIYQHRSPFIYNTQTTFQSPFTYQHRDPSTYQHRSPSTYARQGQTPVIYQHRSPLAYTNANKSAQTTINYQHQSPSIVQQPSIYQHQSPSTYQHRSPSTYARQGQTPTTYQHRSPLTYDHRSPLTYNHRSPFTYSSRTPFIFDGVDGDDAGVSNTSWGPGDSNADVYTTGSDVTSNRLWDSQINSSSGGNHNASVAMRFDYQSSGSNAGTLRARWHMNKSAQTTTISRYEDYIQTHSPSGIDSSWSWDVKWESTTSGGVAVSSTSTANGVGPILAEDTYHNVWNGTTASAKQFIWYASTGNTSGESEANVFSQAVKFTVRVSKTGETSLYTSTTAQNVGVFIVNTGGSGDPGSGR